MSGARSVSRPSPIWAGSTRARVSALAKETGREVQVNHFENHPGRGWNRLPISLGIIAGILQLCCDRAARMYLPARAPGRYRAEGSLFETLHPAVSPICLFERQDVGGPDALLLLPLSTGTAPHAPLLPSLSHVPHPERAVNEAAEAARRSLEEKKQGCSGRLCIT